MFFLFSMVGFGLSWFRFVSYFSILCCFFFRGFCLGLVIVFFLSEIGVWGFGVVLGELVRGELGEYLEGFVILVV